MSNIVKPEIFIVGAPKCGTTSLYAYLKQHPNIFFPDRKEPHHFCTDLTASYPYVIRDRQEYLDLYRGASTDRSGEASTWYLYSKVAAENIQAFQPNARIIIMLRNPVDMLYSLHSQRVYTCNEDIEEFRLALAAESKRKRGLGIPRNCQFIEGLYYKEVVRYSEQIKRYLKVFDRSQVKIIIYDDFKENTESVYRNVLEFLEIAPDFNPDFMRANKNKKVRSRLIHRTLNQPYGIIRKIGKRIVPRHLRNNVRQRVNQLNISVQERPSLDPELENELKTAFFDEINDLSDLLERDLTHWVKPLQRKAPQDNKGVVSTL